MLAKDLGTWHLRGWSYDKDYFWRAHRAISFKSSFSQFINGVSYLDEDNQSHRENWIRMETVEIVSKAGFKRTFYVMKKENFLALSLGIDWEGFGKMPDYKEIW